MKTKKSTAKAIPLELTLAGELTIHHCEAIKEQLLAALRQQDKVQVVLQDVEAVDTTFIQLIIASRMSAQKSGKTLTVAGTLPAEVEQTLRLASSYEVIFQPSI